MSSLVIAKDIYKAYRADEPVLQGASLELEAGESVALLGASGSGKSTLLHCLGCLDTPDRGEIFFEGRNLLKQSKSEAARFRLESLGFVFQFHHLIPELSVIENVLLPASLMGEEPRARAEELLRKVGLGTKLDRFPWQLSGGEQQRVAVARALINRPRLILTDEATGNLDRPRAVEIINLLLELNREAGSTLLSVTHDEQLAARYGRQYCLKDGRIWDCVEPS